MGILLGPAGGAWSEISELVVACEALPDFDTLRILCFPAQIPRPMHSYRRKKGGGHIPHGTIGTVIQGVGGVYERFADRLFEESENGERRGKDCGKSGHIELSPFKPKFPPRFCEGRGVRGVEDP